MGSMFPPTWEEIHAFVFGLWDGLHYKNGPERFQIAKDAYGEVRAEPHYYKGAYMIARNGLIPVGSAGVGAVATSPICQNILSLLI